MNPSDGNIPPRTPTDSPSMGQRIYDTSSVHRISQAALVRNRLTDGISPATVTGFAAMIAKMESQLQDPLLSITITSTFPGFQRFMTYQNGNWSGHDFTHHLHDDRASTSYSSTSGGVQQNRPRQLFAAPAPPQQTPQPTLPQAKEPWALRLLLHTFQLLPTCLSVR